MTGAVRRRGSWPRWSTTSLQLMWYSSPSRTMLVRMVVASEEATPGSVTAKDNRISPCRSGSSHWTVCSGGSNSDGTSSVAGVPRGAVRGGGRQAVDPARELGERRVLQVGQPRAFLPQQEKVPQPRRPGLLAQVGQHGRRRPRSALVAFIQLLVEDRLGRLDVAVDDVEQVFPQSVGLAVEGKFIVPSGRSRGGRRALAAALARVEARERGCPVLQVAGDALRDVGPLEGLQHLHVRLRQGRREVAVHGLPHLLLDDMRGRG